MIELRRITRHNLIKNGHKLKEQGRYGYRALDNRQMIPVAAWSLVRSHSDWKSADFEHGLEIFKRELADLGFNEFKSFSRGSTARVYIGRRLEGSTYRYYALRTSEYGTGRDGNDRAPSILNLQPYAQFTTNAFNAERLEVLPLVHMYRGRFGYALREAFKPAVKSLQSIEGNYSCFMAKDIGVLPDGTPLEVDPGNLNIAPNANSEAVQADIEALDAYVRDFDMGHFAPYKWYSADGKPKQEAFFPSSFDNQPTPAKKWAPR